MLLTCYTAVGNSQSARRVAQITLSRTEKTLAQDPNNGTAMAYGAVCSCGSGEAERAKDWMNRALLIDPDNMNARYNFACQMAAHLKDSEAALKLLGPVFETLAIRLLESRQSRSGPRSSA